MITVYKEKAIPKDMELIKLNDIYFNKFTADKLDDKAADIIRQIDQSEMSDRFYIKSRFDGGILNIDKLSSGCKTVLNIMYNPKKVFDIRECGENAIDIIYGLETGNITCEYPLISFEMEKVMAVDKTGSKEFDSYDTLKEWWSNEDKAGYNK